MILLFDKQFVKPIRKDVKIHTIREDKGNRWKGFKLIHFKAWSGKPYRSPMFDFRESTMMQGTQDVFMSISQGRVCISIDDKELFGWPERNEFAINEGFENWEAFEDYFYPIIDKMEDLIYKAKLIHWTDKRY